MRDSRFKEIEVGQIVHFGLRYDQWNGEVVEVSHEEEQIVVKKKIPYYDDEYKYETFNRIACSNYITIIKD